MKLSKTCFQPVSISLADLLGAEYAEAVAAARAAIAREPAQAIRRRLRAPVECLPEAFQRRLLGLLPRTGSVVGRSLKRTPAGASTRAYNAATHLALAPLSGCGYFRIGEDGRQYFTLKSEHYHAPVGHAFPGYRLLDTARGLGIPNATHNNTRGFITRRLEEELVRAANGIGPADWRRRRGAVLADASPHLNRVINLETGSLAMEAALKLVLTRFYQSQAGTPAPVYGGRIPVLVVLGNDQGELAGNYHGTTILAQTLRGMWPEMRARLEKSGCLLVKTLRPNSLADAREVFARFDRAPYKIAGFFHEIVMMNYGGRLLSKKFLDEVYALCRKHDVPAVVDEIQSCMWHHDFFMFREYGLKPAMVAIGKGFPGGEYPASRIIFNSKFDVLPQFGALVTNGQEELAALAYLITMRWAAANAKMARSVGEYYFGQLEKLAARFSGSIARIEGCRHLAGIGFNALEPARAFVRRLNAAGLDISVQTYKADCPPVALTKLPLIAGYEAVDWVLAQFEAALKAG
jgi:acetylornithine/succinyldiaminopimelate/putrescine aminotransferase